MTDETTADALRRADEAYNDAIRSYEELLNQSRSDFENLISEAVSKIGDLVENAVKEAKKEPEPAPQPGCQWIEKDGEKYLLMNEAGAEAFYNTFAAVTEVLTELQRNQQRTR